MLIFKGSLLVLAALMLLPTAGLSKTGSMNGFILDAYSDDVIPHAFVIIENGEYGITADGKGYFEIDDIPAGEITIEVNRIGYRGLTRKVQIEAGERRHLKVYLEAEAVKFRTMIVTATRDPMRPSLA